MPKYPQGYLLPIYWLKIWYFTTNISKRVPVGFPTRLRKTWGKKKKKKKILLTIISKSASLIEWKNARQDVLKQLVRKLKWGENIINLIL